MRIRQVTVLLGAMLLGGCGKVSQLQPAPGQHLPVKPLLARATPTPEELLTPPVYAKPERIDELMKRSEPRQPDRFDLPPADGGFAPVLPETEEPTSSERKGPVDPQ